MTEMLAKGVGTIEEMLAELPPHVRMLAEEFPPFKQMTMPDGQPVWVVGYNINDKDGHETLMLCDRDPRAAVKEAERRAAAGGPDFLVEEVNVIQVCAHHFRPGGADSCGPQKRH